ncbi:MAG TPA: Crp/Fnr family transcriptional regulator [Alphaproteobacteria bacterium]|nr:Crp/Fnr family transcriptional regulator [Alphaproteobacteria bacterium]
MLSDRENSAFSLGRDSRIFDCQHEAGFGNLPLWPDFSPLLAETNLSELLRPRKGEGATLAKRRPRSEKRYESMIQSHEDGITNRMLRSLPPVTLERILPALEIFDTVQWQVLYHTDRPIEHVYFVNRGLVSFIKIMRDGRTVGIGARGIEGVINSNALITGMDKAIVEYIVQIPGTAYRIKTNILRDEMARDDALREVMLKFARFGIGQLVQDAACNRLHSIKERCCRWLLTAHDSALCDTFPLTHEFLAMMLGVQRAGVSIAASSLQKAELIQNTRGRVTIRNRSGLENAACECYGVSRAQLETLFGTAQRGGINWRKQTPAFSGMRPP